MTVTQVLSLAAVQAITEFLPVSSSGHLALVPLLVSQWTDQGLMFDIAVHFGTLLAVLAYFRRDLALMARAVVTRGGAPSTVWRRLAWGSVLASVPIAVAGLLLHGFVESYVRENRVAFIAAAMVVFGLFLGLADAIGKRSRGEADLGWRGFLWIGLAQACAVFPGVSRSGVTITAARAAGLGRVAAARVSFLLSIPAISMAVAFAGVKLASETSAIEPGALALGIAASAVSGYACIHVLLRFVERIGMLPFVVYRLALGAFLLHLLATSVAPTADAAALNPLCQALAGSR